MNENIEDISFLLQKKKVPSSSSGYKENALSCGIDKDMLLSGFDSITSDKELPLEGIGNVNCVDLFQKIGIRTEFVGNSLYSYNRRLQESPYLAETLVAEIINKDITGSELSFIELFDTLRCKHMDTEALKLIMYAYIKLEEQAESLKYFICRSFLLAFYLKRWVQPDLQAI